MIDVALMIEGILLQALRRGVGPLWEVSVAELNWIMRTPHWKYV